MPSRTAKGPGGSHHPHHKRPSQAGHHHHAARREQHHHGHHRRQGGHSGGGSHGSGGASRLTYIHYSEEYSEHNGPASRFGKVLYTLITMDKVVGAVAQIGELKIRNDDDFVDRLSRRYTTFFLVLFAILVSTKQYVGEPINCWVPARFTENHEEYANKICWVSNTYYMPFSRSLPAEEVEARQKIGYYQWIPMILLGQSVLFFLPCMFWRVLNKRSGLNIKAIIDAAIQCQRSSCMGDTREKSVKYMVNHLDAYFGQTRAERTGMWARLKRTMAKRCLCVCGQQYGNYLTTIYLLIKILYIINAGGQLFMLNIFLGTDYHMFGVHVVRALLHGEIWRPTERFPRVTLCDFEVRELGNVNTHTVQCVLPINLFNEKIYIFIWFWFVFVGLCSIINFFHWFWKSFRKRAQVEYIKRQLKSMDRINRETDLQATKFTNEYLRQDGVFVLRLVGKNAGHLLAAELTAGLFDSFGRERRLLTDQSRPGCAPGLPVV